MPRKVKIIMNPVADMGNAWKVADELRPLVKEYGNAEEDRGYSPGKVINVTKVVLQATPKRTGFARRMSSGTTRRCECRFGGLPA
jgi:hypothetical protein